MTRKDRWLLPEGIGELLPPQAERVEALRRRVIDLFHVWGYELVIPPLIDYLDSLLTGVGSDVELQTFKLTDQMSGRLLGVRADMTPQVARIDAHHYEGDEPRRLCYLGPVLHTRPDAVSGSRNPFQVGAELYGHAGIESDAEVICLMLETLRAAGLAQVHVELGHMGVFRALVRQAGLDAEQSSELLELLQRKALPELAEFVGRAGLAAPMRGMLCGLCRLYGGVATLERASAVLAAADGAVHSALEDLRVLTRALARRAPAATLHVDLSELRGYHYHTGVMFRAFTHGQGRALAAGGRYDDIGRFFGRARPATGFSTDLRALIAATGTAAGPVSAVLAPAGDEQDLQQAVAALRAKGTRVIQVLPGQGGDAARLGCDRQLRREGGAWVVVGCDGMSERSA